MRNKLLSTFLLPALLLISLISVAAESSEDVSVSENVVRWTLKECIDYARENNLQVQGARISLSSSEEDLAKSKEQFYPSLNFSTNQSFTNMKGTQLDGSSSTNSKFSGNYNLQSSLPIYQGGRITNSLRQQELTTQGVETSLEVTQNNIEISVSQAFINILYYAETVNINKQTVEASNAEVERTRALYEAGSLSRSDLAQMESQLSSDRYMLTTSETQLQQATLDLKQLLELDLNVDFDIIAPDLDSTDVMVVIPSTAYIYDKALEVMPQVEVSKLKIKSSELGEKIAKAEVLPSISASAGIGTSNYYGSSDSFLKQINNGLNESIGLSMSIPIYNNRSAKTSIRKAKLQTQQAQVDYKTMEKELLKTIESLYTDAVSSQSQYAAAQEKYNATDISYSIMKEQFDAGMKNTLELLQEKNNYLAAVQEVLQAKYKTVLAIKLLNFYQGENIEL